jgi:pimeloyl-ACP methyl ester carboxylesterase
MRFRRAVPADIPSIMEIRLAVEENVLSFQPAAAIILFLLVTAVPSASVSATPPEPVSFSTEDGGMVYADLYGDGKSGIVLVHGGRFTKESWKEQVPILVDAGFRVLAIDLRGRGQSRGPQTEDDDGLRFDVLAAIRFLRASGTSIVSVIGASFGGGAAAEASIMTEPGEIDRLILLAHSPIDEPEQMKGRKLFILTRDDARGEARTPRLPEIRDQYERAPEPKQLVLLDGSAHAQLIFESQESDRLMREILRFLSEPDPAGDQRK